MDIIFSPIVVLFKELSFERAILVILVGLFIYMFKKIINKFSTSLNNTEKERNKANEQVMTLATNHIAHDIQCHEQVKFEMENQTNAIKEQTGVIRELITNLGEGRERAVKEHTGIIAMISEINEKISKG